VAPEIDIKELLTASSGKGKVFCGKDAESYGHVGIPGICKFICLGSRISLLVNGTSM